MKPNESKIKLNELQKEVDNPLDDDVSKIYAKSLEESALLQKSQINSINELTNNVKELIQTLSADKEITIKNPQTIPDSFVIDNLSEIKIPAPIENVSIKESNWLQSMFLGIVDNIKELSNKIAGEVLKVILVGNNNPNSSIAVTLTNKDRTKFVNPSVEAFFNGGGGGTPFIKSNGEHLEALVDDERHLQVDVLTSPGASSSTTPTIFNITMTDANTEYSQALPSGSDKFSIQCRGDVDVRFAFVTGKVAASTAPYMTLKSGLNYYEDDLSLTGITIYVASSTAGQIVELICWT